MRTVTGAVIVGGYGTRNTRTRAGVVTAPTVRRPLQTVIDGFAVLYVEGSTIPWRVVPADAAARDQLGDTESLVKCRRRRDAVAAIETGICARALARHLHDHHREGEP